MRPSKFIGMHPGAIKVNLKLESRVASLPLTGSELKGLQPFSFHWGLHLGWCCCSTYRFEKATFPKIQLSILS